MEPKVVAIDASQITSWDTFHDVFARALGFPSSYGRNMDAWIDCMSHLDEPDAGLTSIHVTPGEVLTLALDRIDDLVTRYPELYEALIDCTAFVNWRRVRTGCASVLALAYDKQS